MESLRSANSKVSIGHPCTHAKCNCRGSVSITRKMFVAYIGSVKVSRKFPLEIQTVPPRPTSAVFRAITNLQMIFQVT